MNNYLIYKHTSPSGKSYIGQTNNYNKRCNHHRSVSSNCRVFTNAIKYYGWDNFTHEILHKNLSLEEANELESICILEHNTLSPNGYNLKTGGLNSNHSQETIEKMRLRAKNRSSDIIDNMIFRCKNMPKESRNKAALTKKLNTFIKLKQQYLLLTLTKDTYSTVEIAKLLSTNKSVITRHLNPTTRTSITGKYVITAQQIHDYFNQ